MTGESSLCTIELGRFQTPTLIKDGARLKIDLFAEVDGVMAFIRKHISKAFIITGKPEREERWEYPLEALREIVINAIVHRDYASSSDSIVKIFDDRIEVFNPGRLPDGLSVEMLLTGDYVSNIRNRKIADMFKEVGLIEKYGTGIRRILREFEASSLPMPKFEEIGGGFRVTVHRGTDVAKETPQVERLLAECVSPKSRLELQQQLGLSDKKHFRAAYLNPSLKAGLIELTNPDKPRSRLQKYRLTEKGRSVLEQVTSPRT